MLVGVCVGDSGHEGWRNYAAGLGVLCELGLPGCVGRYRSEAGVDVFVVIICG